MKKRFLQLIQNLLDENLKDSSSIATSFPDKLLFLYKEAYGIHEDLWYLEFSRLCLDLGTTVDRLDYNTESAPYCALNLYQVLNEITLFFQVRTSLEFTSPNDNNLLINLASSFNQFERGQFSIENLLVELLYFLDQLEFKAYEWAKKLEFEVQFLSWILNHHNSSFSINDNFIRCHLKESKAVSCLYDFDIQLDRKLCWIKNQYTDGSISYKYVILSLIELENSIEKSSLNDKDQLLIIINKIKDFIRPYKEDLSSIAQSKEDLLMAESSIYSFIYFQSHSV